jgi:hypothetical protein
MKCLARCFVLLVASAFNQSIHGQALKSGTVVVELRTKDQILIAADSLGTFSNNATTDRDCKISIYASKVAFASAGASKYDPLIKSERRWDAHALARRVSLGNHRTIQQMASAWGMAGSDFFRPIAAQNPEEFIRWFKVSSEAIINQGIFAGIEPSGDFESLHVAIYIDPTKIGKGIVYFKIDPRTADGSSHVFGTKGDLVREFAEGETPRARAENARWGSTLPKSINPKDLEALMVAHLVQLAVDYHVSGVGGPVDEIRVDRSGPQWIRKKPICPVVE